MTRETTIAWPEDALGCPLRADYSGKIDQRFVRTEVADGPARYRRHRQDERRVYSLTFLWTQKQVSAWETFHESMLAVGVRWFMMKQATANGMVPMFCHMLAGWDLTPHDTLLDRFLIRFDVEAFHSPASAPPPGFTAPPVAGGTPSAPASDVWDGRNTSEPRPDDIVDALSPGSIA